MCMPYEAARFGDTYSKYGVAGAATMLGMTAAEVEAATYDPIAEIKSYLDGLK